MLKMYFEMAGVTAVVGTSLAGVATMVYLAYRGLRMLSKNEVGRAHDTGFNDGYEQGKQFGYTKGVVAGKNAGRESGYCIGYDEGYTRARAGEYYRGCTPEMLEKFGAPQSAAPLVSGDDPDFDEILKIFESGEAKGAAKAGALEQSVEDAESEALAESELGDEEMSVDISAASDEMGGESHD